jgi:restriction endonuclease
LISKSIKALDKELKITPLHYSVTRGDQQDETSIDQIKRGDGFVVRENITETLTNFVPAVVKYDLIGKVAESTQLTRRTIAGILSGINVAVFGQYKRNPEDFILKAGRLINEQKATVIVEHLSYNPDWAIAFKQDKVKHVFFIAETKGSLSSMDLRKIEESKIECARKFFAKITTDQVKYDVADSYGKLMELVK